MPEFEELRLVVTLTDNATAGLRLLNSEIDRFNATIAATGTTAGGTRNSTARGRQGISQFAAGVRDALRDVGNFNRQLLEAGQGIGLMGRGGPFGAAMLGVPALLAATNAGLVNFSHKMIDL